MPPLAEMWKRWNRRSHGPVLGHLGAGLEVEVGPRLVSEVASMIVV